ncbi:3-phosphoshikimate 1-carboxyvinyltransferase [Psychrosphaera algicola]|uniref:3-phosphoshikimate 1-carboxyvinyltransferase n=1 Tax=Psychrosphaera algicola TaxID=3023714 RepID=A0ABT5FBF9_9GAMM|nr:3-phosphoshikimate 1-carboxyvinyltransferase [Psychrosphaera sp. G1-22]MDC2887916.1 3-phosphoshikimate 1-carboxyvinyltransferase [Psychrosphaera sp. G1-22]
MANQESLTLPHISGFKGDVTVPGSKSLSNRALLLAALCDGDTTITNLLDSDDIRHMLNALELLGVKTTLSADKTTCVVHGCNGQFKQPQQALFLGNAGTAMRPLAAVLAFANITTELTGEERMSERPIGHLVDAIRPLGATITYLGNENYPPLKIEPAVITDDTVVEIDGSVSSQFLSALLMAAPLIHKTITVKVIGDLVSKPYIDLTIDIIRQFGVEVENNNYQSFVVNADAQYQSPSDFMVEGDASSASYFLAAGAISGGPVNVYGVGKNSVQGDIQFADVLAKMGADITYFDDHISVSSNGKLTAVDMDMNHIPDAAMTIATTALFAEGTTAIRNIYNWRVKETDRLFAMATELKKAGAIVEEGHDYIIVTPAPIKHAAIDTYNDHRIAMCFSLLCFDQASVTINDPKVTSKTFPDYFDRFNALVC